MISEIATTTINEVMDFASAPQTQEAVAQAKVGSHDLWLAFLNIDWSAPSWDIIILLFFLVSVLIYGFALGRNRVVAILISTYLSLAVTTNLPFMDKLTEIINRYVTFTFQVSSFLIVFILLFFLLTRGSLLQKYASLGGSWWQVIIFSLLQVGLLTSIILSFLPSEAYSNLSEFTKTVFISDVGKFCWIILPISGLIFFKGDLDQLA
ncbi:MAG: hypothetical protein HUU49_01225 [Candidatus Buchananbacteria bacterium]|nr:hypothetical protein [Candidatus Buchananbacteria bacterium]